MQEAGQLRVVGVLIDHGDVILTAEGLLGSNAGERKELLIFNFEIIRILDLANIAAQIKLRPFHNGGNGGCGDGDRPLAHGEHLLGDHYIVQNGVNPVFAGNQRAVGAIQLILCAVVPVQLEGCSAHGSALTIAHRLQGRGNGLAVHKVAVQRDLIAGRISVFLHIIGNRFADGGFRGAVAGISGSDGIDPLGEGRPGCGCAVVGHQRRDIAGGGVGDLEGHIAAAGRLVVCRNAGTQVDIEAQRAVTAIRGRCQRRCGWGFAHCEGGGSGVDHGGVWCRASLGDSAAVLGAVHAFCKTVEVQRTGGVSGHIGAGGNGLPGTAAVIPPFPSIVDNAVGNGVC